MSLRSRFAGYVQGIRDAVRQQWLISRAIEEGIRARVEEKKDEQ